MGLNYQTVKHLDLDLILISEIRSQECKQSRSKMLKRKWKTLLKSKKPYLISSVPLWNSKYETSSKKRGGLDIGSRNKSSLSYKKVACSDTSKRKACAFLMNNSNLIFICVTIIDKHNLTKLISTQTLVCKFTAQTEQTGKQGSESFD